MYPEPLQVKSLLLLYSYMHRTNKQDYLLENLEGGAIGILQQWVM